MIPTSSASLLPFDLLLRPGPHHYAGPLAIDMTRTGEGSQVRCDIPGTSPDKVTVSFDASILTIAAERDAEDEGLSVSREPLLRERHTARHADRRIRLGDRIDPERISARIEHGVFEIDTPYRNNTRGRTIPVETPGPAGHFTRHAPPTRRARTDPQRLVGGHAA